MSKIGKIASTVGNVMGDVFAPETMALIPGTQMHKMQVNANNNQEIEKLQELQTADDAASTKAGALAQPKLLTGEENIATSADGKTRYQRYEMPDKSTQWVPEGSAPPTPAPQIKTAAAEAKPAVGLPKMNVAPQPQVGEAGTMQNAGLPQGAVIGKPQAEKADTKEDRLARMATLTNAEAGGTLTPATTTELKNLRAELTVPQRDIDNYNSVIDKSLKGAGLTGDTSIFHIPANATPEDVKTYMADAKTQAGQSWQGQAEDRKIRDENRKQEAKDKATQGYVEAQDKDGNPTTFMASQHDFNQAAGNGGVVPSGPLKGTKLVGNFEEAKAGQFAKDRQQVTILNDVQRNVSRMNESIEKDLPEVQKNPEDVRRLEEIMALQDQTGGSALSIGAHGLSLNNLAPVTSAQIKAGALEQVRDDLKNLSPSAQRMLTSYLRTATAVVAYQKAVTGGSRASELQLNLELANIPQPYWDESTSKDRLKAFQENVSQVSAAYPRNLPGVQHPDDLKKKLEKEGTYTAPKPEDVVNSATYKGKQIHKLRDGSVVDNDGKPVEVK
jgi:hypothetical protein